MFFYLYGDYFLVFSLLIFSKIVGEKLTSKGVLSFH